MGALYGNGVFLPFLVSASRGYCTRRHDTLLQCSNSLHEVMLIHDQIVRDGQDHALSLNNVLLQMYGKCDSAKTTQGLFCRMHQRDLYSWNFVIRAHIWHHQYKHLILKFLWRMQEEGLIPNSYVFSSIFVAFSGQISFPVAHRLHVQAASSGYINDTYAGTALINMYGKYDSLVKSWEVFGQIHTQDVVFWNTLIVLCIEHGLSEQSIKLYCRMPLEGIFPSDVTYISILDAFSNITDLGRCREIHVNVTNSPYKDDTVLGTAFLNMYAKCHMLDEACAIYDAIINKDTICWNAMLAAYVQNGESMIAIQLSHRMWQEGVLFDKFSFCSALSACGTEQLKGTGKNLHVILLQQAFDSDNMVSNALISVYGKCGVLDRAWNSFTSLNNRDVVSWNAIIGSCKQMLQDEMCLQLFEQMKQEAVLPNNITLVTLIESISNFDLDTKGQQLQACIYGHGMPPDTAIGNALVNMYGNLGRLKEAKIIFDFLICKDRTSYINYILACASKGILEEGQETHATVVAAGLNSMLAVASAVVKMYGMCGRLEDAWSSFCKQTERDVVLYTAMISACVYNGEVEGALSLFEEMNKVGIKADKVTAVNILDACASHVALAEGSLMHNHIIVNALDNDLVVGTALVDMYGKCGMLEDACRVFKNLEQRDAISWTALVAAHAQHGQVEKAEQLLYQIRQEGIAPNEATFKSILNACSHSGLVDEGRQWFRLMKSDYGITPAVDHYNCMIGLLGRAGLTEEAGTLVNEMPVTPTSVTWNTLLGIWNDRIDVLHGKHLAECVLELNPNKSSAYVSLSNIYSGPILT